MAVDPGTWGIEQWSLAIAIAGLAFAFSQPFGFLLPSVSPGTGFWRLCRQTEASA
ncbi:hypothetical protein [uncultured Thiodictyon sp.]|uniref:hypothetical protein n=1 Tax=uncultured Thiodictyon sp. TaxID=1846217 RepID=UPI0025F37AB6|nr:hypothetical protein [uncultured Thiodictyon sp.]